MGSILYAKTSCYLVSVRGRPFAGERAIFYPEEEVLGSFGGKVKFF